MAVGGPGAGVVAIVAGRITVNLLVVSGDLLTIYGASAKVYLERDTSSGFAAPTVVTSTAIVSGTEQIEFSDTSGTSSSWYRVRVGNSGGTIYGDYSTGMQATALLAYASIDDLAATMHLPTQAQYALLSNMLVDAAGHIDQLCSRDFYRHPQVTGDQTVVFQIKRGGERYLTRAIRQPLDIISVTTLEIAATVNSTYSTLSQGSSGWYYMPELARTGWPYEDVLLSPQANAYLTFPAGGLVRLTYAGGWPAVPPLVRRANVDLAREWYRQGPGGGGPIGMSALGQPIFGPGTPPTLRELGASDYRRRSFLYA